MVSGKHCKEVVGDEYQHFSAKLFEKLKLLAQANSSEVPRSAELDCRPIGGTASLARVVGVATNVREELEQLVVKNLQISSGRT